MKIKAYKFTRTFILYGVDKENAIEQLEEKLIDDITDIQDVNSWYCEGEATEFEPIDLD